MPTYITENNAGFDSEGSSICLRGFLPLEHVKHYNGYRIWPRRLSTDYVISGTVGNYVALQDEITRRAAAGMAWAREVNGLTHIVVPNAGRAFPSTEFPTGINAELFMAKLQYSQHGAGIPEEDILVFPTQKKMFFFLGYGERPPSMGEINSNSLKQRAADIAKELRFDFNAAVRRVL
ncbi:MAG: hypothetical protein HY362_03960 [Candidatus Aenigmarchaeota archaeon]|nr:hypothetical protein [Candidatus Aenigmarchaeota archaeon]